MRLVKDEAKVVAVARDHDRYSLGNNQVPFVSIPGTRYVVFIDPGTHRLTALELPKTGRNDWKFVMDFVHEKYGDHADEFDFGCVSLREGEWK